jgi:aerobic C4-dicarboxylate transport protein
VIKNLYVQVLIAIALGVLLGFLAPEWGAAMKPLGDGFIKIVKMLIAPIVFTTVVVGIAQMGAMKDVGRIGLRALVYFEVVSTLALAIGLVVVSIVQPGAGIGFDASTSDPKAVAAYTTGASHLTTTDPPTSSSISSPTRSSGRSPAAKCCKCSSSRSCSGWYCSEWETRHGRWSI